MWVLRRAERVPSCYILKLKQWQKRVPLDIVCVDAVAVRTACRRRAPGAFVANELVTSKYNLLNFIPVNLYHQFKRVANMYFAALVCLQVRDCKGVGERLCARQDTYNSIAAWLAVAGVLG